MLLVVTGFTTFHISVARRGKASLWLSQLLLHAATCWRACAMEWALLAADAADISAVFLFLLGTTGCSSPEAAPVFGFDLDSSIFVKHLRNRNQISANLGSIFQDHFFDDQAQF